MIKRRAYSTTYKNPRVFSSPRRRAREKNSSGLLKKILVFLFLILLLIAINALLTIDYFKIKNIKVQGDPGFSKAVEEITKQELDKPRLFVYKNNNFLIFSASGLQKAVLDKIKEIKYITIKRSFPDTLDISIKEKKAKVGWETEERKFLIDDEGLVLKEVNNFDNLSVMVIKDTSNLPISDNKQVVYSNFIQFVENISNKINNTGISVDHMEVKETTFIIDVVTKEGVKIIFDTTKDSDGQINKLAETLKQVGEQKKNLDYIDLTVNNKSIYKFK